MVINKFFVVISGPTAVGKTDFVNILINKLKFKAEVVNADLGQFYKPLSIGTAKPDLSKQIIKHNLFDILDEPRNFTVLEYRNMLIKCMEKLWQENIVPIVVGGSSFYIKSIFFSPKIYKQSNNNNKILDFSKYSTQELFNKLYNIDINRAKNINPNDRYRIERALELWYKTGQKPSLFKPEFEPPGQCAFYFLNRDRADLYNNINKRTEIMLDLGWIEEVKNLDNKWKDFLNKKKLIGYPEIIKYLENKNKNKEDLINKIAQKTRNYAKRQITFWRALKLLLLRADPENKFVKDIQEINLSLLNFDLCAEQLSNKLEEFVNIY